MAGGARLSDTERAVALAVQFNADAPAHAVAKEVGAQTHSVHYALNSLADKRVLRPWLALNHFALGYEQFDIFFSLSTSSSAAKQKLLAALSRDPNVLWYAELGGEYQYAFSLYAKSVAEASAFLDNLAERSKAVFVRKQISVVVFFSLFKKKYLCPDKPSVYRGSIRFQRPAAIVELDNVDNKVLAGLYDQPAASRPALARALGMPRSTLELRIKRLREKGVLLAFICHISAERLQAHSYKVLIYAKGVRPELGNKLLKFAEAAVNVVNFGRCFGHWDYELGVEVWEAGEIAALTAELYDRFGEEIDHLDVIPVFKRSVSSRFMRGKITHSGTDTV